MLSSSEKSVRNIPMTHPRIKILALLRISFAKSENMTPLPIRTYVQYIHTSHGGARWTGMVGMHRTQQNLLICFNKFLFSIAIAIAVAVANIQFN